MIISGIYKIVNKANGRYYIGSSKDIHRRWLQHQRELADRTHHNAHLINAWHKYGKDSFEVAVLEEVSIDKLYEVEQRYLDICAANPSEAYNLNYAPDGGRPSEESIRKISEKLKGRVFTEEHKRRIGKAMIGRPYSEETRAKIGRYSSTRIHSEDVCSQISLSLTGQKRSEETRNLMSLAGRGKHSGPRDLTIRVFRNERTGEVFSGTVCELKHKIGKSPYMVSEMIKGKRETVKGWRIVTPQSEMRGAA